MGGGTAKVHLQRLDAGCDICDSYGTIEDEAKADKSGTTESGTLSLLVVFPKLIFSILVLLCAFRRPSLFLLCKFLKCTPDRETFRVAVRYYISVFFFYFPSIILINILSLLTEAGLDKTMSTVESHRIIPGNSSLTDTVSVKLVISKGSDTEHDMATSQEANEDQAKTNKQEEGNVL